MRDQVGENGENRRSESESGALRKPLRGGDRKKRERKKQRLSSGVLQRKQTKESGSQASAPEEKSKRGSPVEQLRERSREERKETIRKPSTRIWKEYMRNQVGKKEENARSESGRRAAKNPLRGKVVKKRKGRNRG